MQTTTIFFDLDDTLYPASCGLWKVIKNRINMYMHKKMGFPIDEIDGVRMRLFQIYGTTLRGLQTEYHVNTRDYLSFIHDVPLDNYLRPDPQLQHMLNSLFCRKVIFTNADANHARRVVNALGISECFNAIVDINQMAPFCKPMPKTFEIALHTAGEIEPSSCVLVDDLPKVTSAARDFGFFTVLMGEASPHPDADVVLVNIIDLPNVIT